MNYWKEHSSMRLALMLITFIAGLALLIYGWTLTGQLTGLILMLVGVALVIATLALYNKAFDDPKEK